VATTAKRCRADHRKQCGGGNHKLVVRPRARTPQQPQREQLRAGHGAPPGGAMEPGVRNMHGKRGGKLRVSHAA